MKLAVIRGLIAAAMALPWLLLAEKTRQISVLRAGIEELATTNDRLRSYTGELLRARESAERAQARLIQDVREHMREAHGK